jgi:hypothetical protein
MEKKIAVRCECGSGAECKETIGSLAQKIFAGAKNLEVLINQDPLDLLGRAPSAQECAECGTVYFKGEDARVDAGMKCGKCAYSFGD